MNMMTSLEPLVPCGLAYGLNFRMQIETLVECLIGVLDAIDALDGVELDGDEFDGSMAEDDFCQRNTGGISQPGCPIADPDIAVDDEGVDDRNDDREEESFLIPLYRMDQGRGPANQDADHDRQLMRPHIDRARADSRRRAARWAA